MPKVDPFISAQNYRRSRFRRRAIGICFVLLLVGIVLAERAGAFGSGGDDWARYDHKTFQITGVESGESIRIATRGTSTEIVRLLGIAAPDAGAVAWLNQHAVNHAATLLLPFPQTRDASGRLLAFVFVDRTNLSVELVKDGLAFCRSPGKNIDGWRH